MAARAQARTAHRGGAAAATIPQLRWDQARPAPVVLVSGGEVVLADRAVRLLRDTLRDADPSLEISDLVAPEYQSGRLLSLASPSLFAEPRLIRVEQVEKCSDAFIVDMLAYLDAPADDTVVVLRHGGGVRGKKVLEAIRAGSGGGVEIVCAELKKASEKYDFAKTEFRRADRRITSPALQALTEAFADDLAELAAACAQLIADTDAEITPAVVARYYGGRVETTAFTVADAAIAGRRGEALITLRHALDSGADPVPIVAAFASKVRTMARVAGVRGGSGSLAKQLGVAPWQIERAWRDLRGWDQAGLARCIEMLATTDAEVKGAARDPVFSLERLIRVISSRGTV